MSRSARLKFANGCIATLKASRVNYEPQRSMHVFSQQAFAAIDFAKGEARVIHPAPAVLRGEVDLTCCPPEQRQQVQESMFRELLSLETLQVERTNAILQEQREFVASVLHGAPIRVPGEQGRDALAVAEQILESIRSHRWNSHLPRRHRSSRPLSARPRAIQTRRLTGRTKHWCRLVGPAHLDPYRFRPGRGPRTRSRPATWPPG